MNLSELIREVSKDERIKEIKLRQYEVKVVVKVLIDHIVKALLRDKIVKMQGLFTLEVRKAKGRRMRNPQTGEVMYSKDYYKVRLEPSKPLKEGLENLRDENK